MVLPGENCVHIGRVAKAHGYKGTVKIDLTGNIELKVPKKNEPVFLVINQKPVPFFYSQWQNSGSYQLVQFEDIDTEEAARELVDLPVCVPKKWVKEQEDVSPAQVIGYTVVDSELGQLGPVTNYMETSVQVLLYVQYKGEEVLLPFVEDFFYDVDEETQTLYCTLPEGLLEL